MAGATASDGPAEEEHSASLRPWMRFVHVHYAVNAAVSAKACAVSQTILLYIVPYFWCVIQSLRQPLALLSCVIARNINITTFCI